MNPSQAGKTLVAGRWRNTNKKTRQSVMKPVWQARSRKAAKKRANTGKN